MRKLLVKTIAAVCALIGIYYLFLNWRGHVWYLSELYKGQYPFVDHDIWMVVITIGATIILLLRPIAGYALFRLKKWGKNLAVCVLATDFLIRGIGFIHTWTYSIRNPQQKKIAEEMLKSAKEAQARGENVHIEAVSMIPSYIIGIVSLISVVLLLKINLKKLSE